MRLVVDVTIIILFNLRELGSKTHLSHMNVQVKFSSHNMIKFKRYIGNEEKFTGDDRLLCIAFLTHSKKSWLARNCIRDWVV